jgi:hypothetical protein
VYLREAHPADGWIAGKDPVSKEVYQPKTFTERTEVAVKCCSALKITMPMVVDEMDDRVGHAYSAMPDRLYVIDRAGRIAYKAGRGPSGFKPLEMEQSLIMLLTEDNNGRASATR